MSDVKVFAKDLELSAQQQIEQIKELEPFKNEKVRIMADAHSGKGCVVGFTSTITNNLIIPNIIGLDLGCGVKAVKIPVKKADEKFFKKLDTIIHECVPSGYNVNDHTLVPFDLSRLTCYRELNNSHKRINKAIGSLGSGNHFIELDKSSNGEFWLTVHTGSRNLGKQVAELYQKKAIMQHKGSGDFFSEKQRIIDTYKEQGRRSEIQEALQKFVKEYNEMSPDVPEDLCWLSGQLAKDYLHDMYICQEYAELNRATILNTILNNLNVEALDEIESVHNYISKDRIIRKGAIEARENQRVIIPLNMRDGVIIGTGKSNEDYNFSGPHGAGRRMSRTQAKNNLTMEDYQEQMKGIYSTCIDKSTLDEAPKAYKPAKHIIEGIVDTVDIEEVLKPVYSFKATDSTEPKWKRDKEKKKLQQERRELRKNNGR